MLNAGAQVTIHWGGNRKLDVDLSLRAGKMPSTDSQLFVEGIREAGVSIMEQLTQPEREDITQQAATYWKNLLEPHT